MAIEDILRALEEQAQADIDAVLTEARDHATHIVTQGENEAAGIRDGFARSVERNANANASKALNAARLEAKMTVSSARGNAVESVFAAAKEKLAGLPQSGDYDRLFASFAAEALDGLSGDVVMHVIAADAERARTAAAAAGVTAVVETDLVASGGLVVEANGGRIVRRNTFEDRLERARPFVQADVAKVLFG